MAITSVLSGGSSIEDQLGLGHVVAGKFTATAGTDAVLTCNDNSAVLTRTATGDFTVTFGEPFLVAPIVTAQAVRATFATTSAVTVEVYAAATNAVSFNVVTNTTGGTVTGLGELADVHFIVVGKRYN